MNNTSTIHLSKIIDSIQVGYLTGEHLEVAKNTKNEICNLFADIDPLLEEFYECILRDEGFKNYVEGQMKKSVNNPILNTLNQDDVALSLKLYLSGYYKDNRKVFDFNKSSSKPNNNTGAFDKFSLN